MSERTRRPEGRGRPRDVREPATEPLDDRRNERPRPEHHAGDRWEWRRRIRADPSKYPIYKVAVGVLGVFLILLGAATGWLPGPGGIPLVLAGLAVLASEFVWARRLLHWLKCKLQQGRAWLERQPRWVSWAGGVATLVGIAGGLWLWLAVFGYPGWTPHLVSAFLGHLPGVQGSD